MPAVPVGHSLAVLVEDEQLAEDRACPTVPGWASHSAESQKVKPLRLGRAVVLGDDRPQPLDHRLLDRDRARRGGVDDPLQRRTCRTVALTSAGSFSSRVNIVGTIWQFVTR